MANKAAIKPHRAGFRNLDHALASRRAAQYEALEERFPRPRKRAKVAEKRLKTLIRWDFVWETDGSAEAGCPTS